MTCLELLSRSAQDSESLRQCRKAQADLSRYTTLQPQGKRLISDWFNRARNMQRLPDENHFEAFICLWISFNGWAACITDLDSDREWLDALMLSQKIQQDFAQFVSNPNTVTHQKMQNFYHFWPVFKAQSIRRQSVDIVEGQGNRQAVVARYFQAGINKFEPQCWQRHIRENSAAPMDWPHTLAVIYRVRCNLFHGDKAIHSEMNHLIVSAAFQTLTAFMCEAQYLDQ